MHRKQSRQMFIYLKKRKVPILISASIALFYHIVFHHLYYFSKYWDIVDSINNIEMIFQNLYMYIFELNKKSLNT